MRRKTQLRGNDPSEETPVFDARRLAWLLNPGFFHSLKWNLPRGLRVVRELVRGTPKNFNHPPVTR
jgi:hypothetical protein